MMIAKSVQRLEPYVPGEQPKARSVVKLNTNENPYPPSPKCAEVLRDFDLDRLRRYPDPEFAELRKAIGRLNGCEASRVFVGNGSDEILSLAAKAFVENDGAIGSLDPSYSLYKTLAAIRDVPWEGAEKDFNAEAQRRREENTGFSREERVEHEKSLHDSTRSTRQNSIGPVSSAPLRLCVKNSSLFLWTNPNAPTGEFVEPEEIAAFARTFKGVVIVDEAYADFARANCMSLATAEGNHNLIVMRTFSKSYSLAGLRVGYCVGPQELIDALYKVKDSYNVDAVAQAIALAALRDQRWMKANAVKIRRTRRWFAAELERRGWDVIPSESNFVFAKPPEGDSNAEAQRRREEEPFRQDSKTGLTGLSFQISDLRFKISGEAQPSKISNHKSQISNGTPVNPVQKSCLETSAPLRLCVEKTAAEIFAYLKTKNIFVRYFKGPKTGDRLRITIGTDEQMKKLLAALDNYAKQTINAAREDARPPKSHGRNKLRPSHNT